MKRLSLVSQVKRTAPARPGRDEKAATTALKTIVTSNMTGSFTGHLHHALVLADERRCDVFDVHEVRE